MARRRDVPALRPRKLGSWANLEPPVLGRIAQSAAAAGIAWELALQLPDHGQPFFAPIAAVIALGAERGRRGRQAIQMMSGVALGILVGAGLLAVAGTGAWQLVVGTLVALLLTTGAGVAPIVRNQAAASTILVLALHRPGSNLAVQRFEDALIGGAIAIVLARFLFPVDPVTIVLDRARSLRRRLAAALDEVAAALETGDRQRAAPRWPPSTPSTSTSWPKRSCSPARSFVRRRGGGRCGGGSTPSATSTASWRPRSATAM